MNSSRLRASFALDASVLLKTGAANDAALLCVSGLGMYPDYLGGYVLLAQAYDALERPLDARIIIEEAQRRFPSFVPIEPRSVASNVEVNNEAENDAELDVLELVVPAPQEPLRAAHHSTSTSPLRIIDTAHIGDDTRIIRSASVRLIPGLEFTTLRFEGTKTRGRREIQTLSDPPPLRRFHPARRVLQPVPQQSQTLGGGRPQPKPASKPLSLEELANRLERARMPRSGEPTTPLPSIAPTSHPIIPTSANLGLPQPQTLVTETIARIYMQQGAYDRAIDAYTALAISKPEKSEEYQRIIVELTAKLNS